MSRLPEAGELKMCPHSRSPPQILYSTPVKLSLTLLLPSTWPPIPAVLGGLSKQGVKTTQMCVIVNFIGVRHLRAGVEVFGLIIRLTSTVKRPQPTNSVRKIIEAP